MKPFHPTKILRRTVKIKSSDRTLADAEWVLTLGAAGVSIKRLGAHGAGMRLSWRSVIGHALIHRGERS